jgi:inorganic pyrophosphatase
MANLDASVREVTDALDAAGNTTAAIGKGFAIGSAALVALALFGAFKDRAKITTVNVAEAWTFAGLFVGALLPYAFSAMTMKSVSIAAKDMVKECARQFPLILGKVAGKAKQDPEYEKCIRISTQASLQEMIAPGLLVILSPLVVGIAFGKNCAAGLLVGALVSGVQLAISMSNSGGAWDNSKKFLKSSDCGDWMATVGLKDASGKVDEAKFKEAKNNSITGDTVGDPLKDTSGPSLNILIKLSAITSLVFATVIAHYSNDDGAPFWLAATTATV